MLKHLRALRQRIVERRQYDALVAELERINAAETLMNGDDVSASMAHASRPRSTRP